MPHRPTSAPTATQENFRTNIPVAHGNAVTKPAYQSLQTVVSAALSPARRNIHPADNSDTNEERSLMQHVLDNEHQSSDIRQPRGWPLPGASC